MQNFQDGGGVDGFGEIRSGAEAGGAFDVGGRRATAQKNHGNFFGALVGFKQNQKFKTIAARQFNIEQNSIGQSDGFFKKIQRRLTIGSMMNLGSFSADDDFNEDDFK